MVRAGKSRSRPSAGPQREPPGRRAPAPRGADARVIRIIGGTLRGRKLRFAAVPEIRPTPDRVRETVFNWLSAHVRGARCLDLFAGSGALGLEALSRGAASVMMVEQNAVAARALTALVAEWQLQGASVKRADALQFLAGHAEPFDLVFLDPPFASSLLAQASARLAHAGWLAHDALIYVESPAGEAPPAVPPAWQPLKAKRAGEVGYHLFSAKKYTAGELEGSRAE